MEWCSFSFFNSKYFPSLLAWLSVKTRTIPIVACGWVGAVIALIQHVTRGHNIVAVGWAGAPTHTQCPPNPPSNADTYTKSFENTCFPTFDSCNGLTDGQSLLYSHVSATKNGLRSISATATSLRSKYYLGQTFKIGNLLI